MTTHNLTEHTGELLLLIFYFQGFRDHKLHDTLLSPGSADLTADVDFSYLRRMVQKRVATLGPLKQKEFLKNMGIDVRLQVRANFVINLFINNLLSPRAQSNLHKGTLSFYLNHLHCPVPQANCQSHIFRPLRKDRKFQG